MGSYIELNDTLQITAAQGFPSERLVLSRHIESPYDATDFKDEVFSFFDKPGPRIFHASPLRVFLVHNTDDRWLYWGHALIIEQTIHSDTNTTSGKFVISKIYDQAHQRSMSTHEVPAGAEYVFP